MYNRKNLIKNGSNQGGGAIYSNHGNIDIKNSSITNNKATGEASFGLSYGFKAGGGFNLNGGTCKITNSIIQENEAMSGAGIFSTECSLSVNDSIISRNDGTKGDKDVINQYYGGGIYANQGTLELNKTIIQNNMSKYMGGGLFLYNISTNLNDSVYIENNSAIAGGGMCIVGGPIEINGANINNNKAIANEEYSSYYQNGCGGAIYNFGIISIKKGNIINNEATYLGNGIYQENLLYLNDNPIFGSTDDIYLIKNKNKPLQDTVITKSGDIALDKTITVTMENVYVGRTILNSNNESTVIADDNNRFNVITNNSKIKAKYSSKQIETSLPVIELGEVANITTNYIDNKTLRPLADTTHFESFINDSYEVLPIQIIGYSLASDSGNTKGTLTEDTNVIFYYEKQPTVCSVLIEYYLINTNTKIHIDDILVGFEGDSYNITTIPIQGYTYDSASSITQGIFTVESQTVKLYYQKILPKTKVTVLYKNQKSQEDIASYDTITGNVGDSYSVIPVAIQGYLFDSADKNLSGTFSTDDIIITLYYNSLPVKSTVNINYFDIDTFSQIHSTDIMDGNIGDTYTIIPIAIQGYYYDSADKSLTGVFSTESNTINLLYKNNTSNVTFDYLDSNSGVFIYASSTITGICGEKYTVTPPNINNYTFTDDYDKLTGQFEINDKHISLNYSRNQGMVIISYKDCNTSYDISPSITLIGNTGDTFIATAKSICNYCLLNTNHCYTSVYNNDIQRIVFFYTKL